MSNKYWDEKANVYCTSISPGEIFITDQHESVVTSVGTNIALCLRDSKHNVGGMSNFLLPNINNKKFQDWSLGFGLYVLKTMQDCIVELGGSKDNLEARLFGGNVDTYNKLNHGPKSVNFLVNYFQEHKITLKSNCTINNHARKVYFYPINGITESKKLSFNDDIYQTEYQYIKKVSALNIKPAS